MTDSAYNTDRGFQPVGVECYSGFKADERPLAFTFQGRRNVVLEILDRWYEGGIDPRRPTVDYFKVRGTDGNDYILRHEAKSWSMMLSSFYHPSTEP